MNYHRLVFTQYVPVWNHFRTVCTSTCTCIPIWTELTLYILVHTRTYWDELQRCRGRVLIYPCLLTLYKGVCTTIEHTKKNQGMQHCCIYSLVRLCTNLSRCTGFKEKRHRTSINGNKTCMYSTYQYILVLRPWFGTLLRIMYTWTSRYIPWCRIHRFSLVCLWYILPLPCQ